MLISTCTRWAVSHFQRESEAHRTFVRIPAGASSTRECLRYFGLYTAHHQYISWPYRVEADTNGDEYRRRRQLRGPDSRAMSP